MADFINNAIAAISTPYGRGGVALIRISGDDAIAVADRMFSLKRGKKLCDCEGGRAYYGDILLENEIIDDGIATLFRAPHSYTGEDTVEITCHGGILISSKVLEACFEAGASPAGPGEFTKRAFMNGKLSLSQAEAVINIIDAETNAALKLSRAHANGALTKKIDKIYSDMLELVSQSYVFADYPDEDLTDVSEEQMVQRLKQIYDGLNALYLTYDTGRAINKGVYTAIVGTPNAGKSSLLNALLGKERAIVSEIEGTTRDFIEESVNIGDIVLRLCDTAGLRDSADVIESIGIKRSYEAIDKAELVLAVFDGSRAVTSGERELIEYLKNCGCKKIAVINKIDLIQNFDIDMSLFDAIIRISTKSAEGIEALKEKISSLFISGEIDYASGELLVSARQASSVKAASNALLRAIEALEKGYTRDVAGLDIEDAMASLMQTDGRQVGMDIVDSIFHNFCVGK